MASQRLHVIEAREEKRAEATTVVPALTQALRDEDVFVRRDAARALGQFGSDGRSALDELLPLLKDRNPSVRRAAAALKRIDPEMAAWAGIP
jgi:HEAT repeat protein